MFQLLFAPRESFAARERRAGRRMRTRLRPGKLLDRKLEFLADCAILDRTATGARVRGFGELPQVDSPIAVFDEKDGTVCAGRLVWRRDGEAGVRFDEAGASSAAEPKVVQRLSAPYYAVTD